MKRARSRGSLQIACVSSPSLTVLIIWENGPPIGLLSKKGPLRVWQLVFRQR